MFLVQCALLYTTVFGERRIRVMTLSLPCTSMLSNLFRSADLDSQFTCMLKQGKVIFIQFPILSCGTSNFCCFSFSLYFVAANGIPVNSLAQVREQMMNFCINILHAYRKFCATVSSSGQLILPEALKLLPLYTLGEF